MGHPPTVAPILNRGVLHVSGSQSSEFLNGLLSSTVPQPQRGHLYSSFIHAQGRLLYDVFLYAHKDLKGNDGYYVEYDSRQSEAPPLLPMLKRYVLRSKVKIRDVTEEWDVWAVWGSESEIKWDKTARLWAWARSGAVEPDWSAENEWPWGREEGIIRDRRAVGMGRRMLVRKGDKPVQSMTHDVAHANEYTLHRILHGVPEGSTEIPPMQAFPMESNLDLMGALDFRKGCYVGQELTVRTYHTGVIRKRILPVLIQEGEHPRDDPPPSHNSPLPPIHTDIKPILAPSPDGTARPRPRGTGKLLSMEEDVGLALMRLDHVEALEKGHLIFQAEAGEGAERNVWTITPWWPTWWPQRPEEPSS